MKNKFLIRSLLTLFLIAVVIYLIPAPKADFFKLYPYSDKPAQGLKEFRSRPTKQLEIDGVKWNYYSGGNGNKTILFLHGMGGAYDLWWQQVVVFEKEYKVITFTLPENINSLENAAKGILKILETENVDKFYAVGTSMGGYITQYLITAIPTRIEKAVFGNTFPPNNSIAEENASKSKIIPLLPELLISRLGKNKLNEEIVPAAKNSPLLKAFLISLPFSKQQFINRYSIVIEKFSIFPNNYEIKRIPKLIIESENDPLIQPKLRKEIKEVYADADVFTFHDEGHFPYINASDDYNRAVKYFFDKENEFEIVEKTITNYFEGRKNANLPQLQNAFSVQANLYTSQDDIELTIPVTEYLNKVQTDGIQHVSAKIINGDITNNIANFKTMFVYENSSYADYLALVKTQNGWKIISKTFAKTK